MLLEVEEDQLIEANTEDQEADLVQDLLQGKCFLKYILLKNFLISSNKI